MNMPGHVYPHTAHGLWSHWDRPSGRELEDLGGL